VSFGESSHQSYFRRPFGAAPSNQDSQSVPLTPSPEPARPAESGSQAARLSSEWEAIEARIRQASSGWNGQAAQTLHAEVGEFLRRWGVLVWEAPAGRQGPLASLLESARAALLGQLSNAAQAGQMSESRQAEARQRQALEQAEHARRLEAGRAEVRRLQDETARIQAETYAAGRLSAERSYQLAKAALFPEQHCPYCSRSYLDLSGGCWHCQHHHRPGYF
jgi:hypothetical protein